MIGIKTQQPQVIKPKLFMDGRGYFFERFKASSYAELGISDPFVQVNESRSEQYTLRGLHLQLPPHEQGKLVSVVEGTIIDVAVDINPYSSSYKKVTTVELSDENKWAFYVPPGYAHGFYVVSPSATVQYMCTGEYNKEAELGIHWNDSSFNIDWEGHDVKDPLLSEKDKQAGQLIEVEPTLKKAYKPT